jgi:predicted Zn-dependent protease
VKAVGSITALWFIAGCSTAPPPPKDVKVPASEVPAAGGVAEPAQALVAAALPRLEAVPVPVAPVLASPSAQVPVAPRPIEVDAGVQRSYEGALQTLRAGRVAEAETVFSTLAMTHPHLGGSSANLGLIFRKAGKLAESLAAFDKAVAANPEQAIFHNQRGITLREMGRFADARAAYERALALAPDYADARLNFGVLLDLYLGEPALALPQFQRYLELTPAGDALVSKWVAELKNRKPEVAAPKEAS